MNRRHVGLHEFPTNLCWFPMTLISTHFTFIAQFNKNASYIRLYYLPQLCQLSCFFSDPDNSTDSHEKLGPSQQLKAGALCLHCIE